jgi:mannosyltransferase OCH1-like enzyme
MKISGSTHGTDGAAVPRIIHQTWSSASVPAAWQGFQRSWQAQHADWQYCLWTDADLDALIEDREPQLVAEYRALPRMIQRVDVAKAAILKHVGGVYADLDTECHRPVGPLLDVGGVVLSRTRDGVIDGAFMASCPGHAFWDDVIAVMRRPPWYARALRHVPGLQASYVLFSTGPFALRRAARRFARRGHRQRMTILDPIYCSNRSWWRRHDDSPIAKQTFVRHHYGDSWLTPAELAVVSVCRPVGVLSLAGMLTFAVVFWLLRGG